MEPTNSGELSRRANVSTKELENPDQIDRMSNETVIQNEPISTSSSNISMSIVSVKICQIITPVTLCSIYTVILVRVAAWNIFEPANIFERVWVNAGLSGAKDGNEGTVLSNFVLVSILVSIIILVTLIILVVLYMEWHACLVYYFFIPSFIIMTLITPLFIKDILISLNWFALDYITLCLIVWNFTALGMIAIFDIFLRTPIYIKQTYLIHNSAILAAMMIRILPGWAPWMLLCFLVVWDLFAVLAPYGPLNIILSLAERRGLNDMPGLIYNTDIGQMAGIARDSRQQNSNSATNNPSLNQEQTVGRRTIETPTGSKQNNIKTDAFSSGKNHSPAIQTDTNYQTHKSARAQINEGTRSETRDGIDEIGVNIGLGDFIFYALLIGITAKGRDRKDFYATLATLDTIAVGLVLTLVVLATAKRVLPALPMSIAMGLIVAAISIQFAAQLSNPLATNQIFI